MAHLPLVDTVPSDDTPSTLGSTKRAPSGMPTSPQPEPGNLRTTIAAGCRPDVFRFVACLEFVTRRKRGSTRPTAKRRWKPESWQVIAAAVTAVGGIFAALITTFGTSGPNSSAADPKPSGSANFAQGTISTSMPATAPPVAISITSFTETPLMPPPGEDFSFSGVVQNFPPPYPTRQPGCTPDPVFPAAQIYVIARLPFKSINSGDNSQHWLVSPAARVINDRIWVVDNWKVSNPPTHAQWEAVVIGPYCEIQNVNNAPPYDDYSTALELYGLSNVFIDAVSRQVKLK